MTRNPGRPALAFYATPPHRCSYLPDREATTLFADPRYPKDMRLYSILSRSGFRRSGEHIYRPHCRSCRACIPVRVAVNEFRLRRAQRRNLRDNQDLETIPCEPRFEREHFALYERYLGARHAGGGMDDPTTEQYIEFLTSSWGRTIFYEFRLGTRLLAVAVTDILLDGCSAVYTFFDPDFPRRGLGVYTILWQIREVQRRNLDWLYLGYVIDQSPKMRYKRDYQPQEHFVNGEWVRVESRA